MYFFRIRIEIFLGVHILKEKWVLGYKYTGECWELIACNIWEISFFFVIEKQGDEVVNEL